MDRGGWRGGGGAKLIKNLSAQPGIRLERLHKDSSHNHIKKNGENILL